MPPPITQAATRRRPQTAEWSAMDDHLVRLDKLLAALSAESTPANQAAIGLHAKNGIGLAQKMVVELEDEVRTLKSLPAPNAWTPGRIQNRLDDPALRQKTEEIRKLKESAALTMSRLNAQLIEAQERYKDVMQPLLRDALLHYITIYLQHGVLLNPQYRMRGTHVLAKTDRSKYQHFPTRWEVQQLMDAGLLDFDLGGWLQQQLPLNPKSDYNTSERNDYAHPSGENFKNAAEHLDKMIGGNAWSEAYNRFVDTRKGNDARQFGIAQTPHGLEFKAYPEDGIAPKNSYRRITNRPVR